MISLNLHSVPMTSIRSAQFKFKQLLVAFILLSASLSASAINMIGLRTDGFYPVKDTLMIHPSLLGKTCTIHTTSHFEGYLEHWYIMIYTPQGMYITSPVRGSDMTLPYMNSNGVWSYYDAILTSHNENTIVGDQLLSSFSSTSTEHGYRDPNNNGNYQDYGPIKWVPGDYGDMFTFTLDIPADLTSCNVKIDFLLSSTYDNRGVGVVSNFHHVKNLCLHVGYQPGDSDGDNVLNISDVTALIDYILGKNTSSDDIYQADSWDVNRDGAVNISDVTDLIDLILGR